MNDDETSRDGEEQPYPIELMNRSHRLPPTPLEGEDETEYANLSAVIKDAEDFELTFEVVETSTSEEPRHVPKRDEEIEKILSPVVHTKESRLPTIAPFEFEEEENDENAPPPGYKKSSYKRSSVASKLAEVFTTPPSRKRKSLKDDINVSTPKSSRRTKT